MPARCASCGVAKRDRLAEELDCPGVRRLRAGENFQQRRFAGAVFAEQRMDLGLRRLRDRRPRAPARRESAWLTPVILRIGAAAAASTEGAGAAAAVMERLALERKESRSASRARRERRSNPGADVDAPPRCRSIAMTMRSASPRSQTRRTPGHAVSFEPHLTSLSRSASLRLALVIATGVSSVICCSGFLPVLRKSASDLDRHASIAWRGTARSSRSRPPSRICASASGNASKPMIGDLRGCAP